MLQSVIGLSAAERETARMVRLREGVLTPIEAAEYLGLSEASLRWYRCKGKGPRAHKDGGRWFYLRDDLDAYRQEVPQ